MAQTSEISPVEAESTEQSDRFSERLRSRRKNLSARMKLVADYIDQNRATVLSKSAIELAKEVGVSDATVIRTIQALGFEGLVDLKRLLENTAGRLDVTSAKLAQTLAELRQDADQAVNYVVEEHKQVLEFLTNRKNLDSIACAISVLSSANRVAVFGIGASGILAEYTVRLFVRNGLPAYALNRTGISLAEQLLQLDQGDALLVLIRENIHREVSTTVEEASRLNVPVVLITGNRRNALSNQSEAVIVIPRSNAEGIPLHGPTLACMEMLMLGVIGRKPERSLATMKRLISLRRSIRARKRQT